MTIPIAIEGFCRGKSIKFINRLNFRIDSACVFRNDMLFVSKPARVLLSIEDIVPGECRFCLSCQGLTKGEEGMPSIGANQINRGNALRIDNEIFICTGAEHVKPGKGPAYVQLKLKHVVSGRILDKRVRSADTLEQVDMARVEASFSYARGKTLIFMTTDTFEEIDIPEDVIGDDKKFLSEGAAITLCMFNDQVLSIDMPKTVILAVVETEPGIKNASATNVGKPAKTNTGLIVTVPPFINAGDRIKVDTETTSYLERYNG
jgi:elongation factor P